MEDENEKDYKFAFIPCYAFNHNIGIEFDALGVTERGVGMRMALQVIFVAVAVVVAIMLHIHSIPQQVCLQSAVPVK